MCKTITLRDLLKELGAQLDPCGRIGFYDDENLDKDITNYLKSMLNE